MSNSLMYFVYLVHLRNEVNLKRRRFLKMSYRFNKPSNSYYRGIQEAPPKHLSYVECRLGYEAAKKELKSMKRKILDMKKELNIKAYQDDNGSYYMISQGEVTIDRKDFKNWATMWIAEEYLLK